MTVQDGWAALRLELFVDDVPAARAFYTQVLGFTAGAAHDDCYVPLQRGSARLALNARAALPAAHPIQAAPGERLGRGIELVLEVEDVAVVYAQVQAAGWPLASTLARRPWGLVDFRVVDPDGYYVRVTAARA